QGRPEDPDCPADGDHPSGSDNARRAETARPAADQAAHSKAAAAETDDRSACDTTTHHPTGDSAPADDHDHSGREPCRADSACNHGANRTTACRDRALGHKGATRQREGRSEPRPQWPAWSLEAMSFRRLPRLR
ncbi:MAG: hypothetical protein QOF27_809, partial [Gaiellaceae bacterium]|nr:hypothetical protein [Gaiellaceae bacterium]